VAISERLAMPKGQKVKIRLAEIVDKKAVVPEIQAPDKEGAIRELVDKLAESGGIEKGLAADVTARILEREALGSTGIGNGIAVPHAKLPGISEPAGVLGRAPGGIDFSSLDGAITHTVFLFVSPADHPEQHVALMSRFVTLIRKTDFVNFFRQTEGAEALHDLLEEVDAW